jgi:hypothetical protein
MTWRQPRAGHLLDAPTPTGRGPVAYLIGSRDPAVLAEVVADHHARRVEPGLVVAELTCDEATELRRRYAGRAVVAPDAPMSPFCS